MKQKRPKNKTRNIITIIICIILALLMILSVVTPALAMEVTEKWESYDIDKDVTFKDYNLDQYKKEIKRSVTNSIYEYINDILKDYPEYTESNEKYIKDGLYADLAVMICVDKEEEPSVAVESIVLHIGDASNINVFPKQVLEELLGKKVGQKFKISIKTSGNNTSFSGKQADYYITVNRIVKPTFYAYDNLTDEYAQNVLGFDSAAHFKAVMEEEAKEHLDEIKTACTQEYITKQAKIKLTRKLIQQKADQYKQIIINQAFNGNVNNYRTTVEKNIGSVKKYEEDIEKKFEISTPAEMAYLSIANKENIKIDEDAFIEYAKSLAVEDSNGSLTQLYYLYDSKYEDGEEYLRRQFLIKKVVEALNDYELDFNTVYKHAEGEKPGKSQTIHVDTINGDGYTQFTIPPYSGFKSFMGYKTITSTGSKQYKLQQFAETAYNGIRTVNGRYCIAVGTYFGADVGTYIDLILENGTVIPCIVGDIKSDQHTDSTRIFTSHNNCCSEFIVDTPKVPSSVKVTGNMSNLQSSWNSPVAYFTVYNESVPL